MPLIVPTQSLQPNKKPFDKTINWLQPLWAMVASASRKNPAGANILETFQKGKTSNNWRCEKIQLNIVSFFKNQPVWQWLGIIVGIANALLLMLSLPFCVGHYPAAAAACNCNVHHATAFGCIAHCAAVISFVLWHLATFFFHAAMFSSVFLCAAAFGYIFSSYHSIWLHFSLCCIVWRALHIVPQHLEALLIVLQWLEVLCIMPWCLMALCIVQWHFKWCLTSCCRAWQCCAALCHSIQWDFLLCLHWAMPLCIVLFFFLVAGAQLLSC